MIFLSDKGREYTYGDLLSAVNTACSYKPLYRASGLYPYFVNSFFLRTAHDRAVKEAFQHLG